VTDTPPTFGAEAPAAAQAIVETLRSVDPQPDIRAILEVDDALTPEPAAEQPAMAEETRAEEAPPAADEPLVADHEAEAPLAAGNPLPEEAPLAAEALPVDDTTDAGTVPQGEAPSVEEDLDFLNLRARLDAWAPPSPAAKPHVPAPAPHAPGPAPLIRRILGGPSVVPAERPAADLASTARPTADVEPVAPATPVVEPAQKWWIVAPESGPDRPGDQVTQPTWPRPAASPAAQVPLRQVAQPPVTPQPAERREAPAWPGVRANATARPRGQDLPLVPAPESVWAASSRDVLNVPGSGVQACASCGLALSAAARFCRRCGTPQGAAHR
jgi:ribonuclease E